MITTTLILLIISRGPPGQAFPARGGAPIVKYDNADIDKVKILKENKGKSGGLSWDKFNKW
jgi:hypothetical protein